MEAGKKQNKLFCISVHALHIIEIEKKELHKYKFYNKETGASCNMG